MLQPVDEFLHILVWIEAQTVHASVYLDVYRPVGDALFLGCMDQCV